MRSLGTRRVALAAGVATAAVIALSGCSAGQVAETALLKTPISGLNTQSPDGRLEIRNLQVVYDDAEGFPANGNAQLELALFNQTQAPITVLISSRPQQTETAGIVSARQIGLTGPAATASAAPSASASASVAPSASASPSAPAEPAAPSVQPARITIPALGSATFLPEDDQKVLAVGLSDRLAPGNSLSLVFEVSGTTQPLELVAPFAIPLSPASRGPVESGEDHE
ncbi:hypothetical protein [Actinoplanes solisilvae]|uniref:hypothetical protein n=1 Tax=Actinoplanes solisilvae TaxID=2486853 RepID=UPI000FDC52EF|nr:hypothetical protein [Actinoplanes solisilvae]